MNKGFFWVFAYIAILFATCATVRAQKGQLVVQTGHTNHVASLAFSPDRRILASGSWDNTVKLWDVMTGTQLRSISAHVAWVNSVAFSPDGKTLASGSNDWSIKLWDVDTGTALRSLVGHADSVLSVTFSPDGKMLASGSCDGGVNLWDAASGRRLRSFRGRPGPIPIDRILGKCMTSVVFSFDGRLLASGSNDGMIYLWDVSAGALQREFEQTNPISAIAISLDNKVVAGGTRSNYNDTIKLWDISSGIQLQSFDGLTGVSSLLFGTDNRTLVSGLGEGGVTLWDIVSGTRLRSFGGGVSCIAISPDRTTLASGSDKSIILWDLRSETVLRNIGGYSEWIQSLAFSPDGAMLASGSALNNHELTIWSLSSGTLHRLLLGENWGVSSVAFSPQGKTIAAARTDGTIRLWDIASNTVVSQFTGHTLWLSPNSWHASSTYLAFSPDGRRLLSASDSNEIDAIRIWDVSVGARLRSLEIREQLASMALSADGTMVAIGTIAGRIKLWNVSTGASRQDLAGHMSWVSTVAFNPDGTTLASGSFDGTIKLWDLSSGQVRHEFNVDVRPHNVEMSNVNYQPIRVNSVAFSPNGGTLASGCGDGTIRLWDTSTGAQLQSLIGHTSAVKSLVFSPDGKILASGSEDVTIRLWDTNRGKELASLISFSPLSWIVVSPDGLFDGSSEAWSKSIWRFNNDNFDYAPIEAFFSDFYHPGLLADLFAGRRPRAPSDITQKDRRQPKLKLSAAADQSNHNMTTRSVAVRIDISEAPAGARDVRLFRNGSLVRVWHGDVMRGESSVALETRVSIVPGENQLTAYAFNDDNVKSSDAPLFGYGEAKFARRGVAYILAIGVNLYANSRYDLKYAVADAQDFAEELKRQQARLNNYEHIEVISLNNKDATKANILKSLSDLSAKIQPEDALVIFFAGHGTAQQNRFYLIPHDLGYTGRRTKLGRAGLRNILAHSISDEEISRAVEGIDAGQMLLVIDACNSGQALEAEEKRRGPMNSKGLAQLAYEKGMYILTAAQSYQAANEAERYGHGFLTYALVEEGLKTDRADRSPKDGQVLLREWLDYATERVPQMQQDELDEQKKQGRQLDRIKFAETDSGNERSLQRPRVFYRRETEPHPLIVAKP